MEQQSLNVLFSKGREDYTTKGTHNRAEYFLVFSLVFIWTHPFQGAKHQNNYGRDRGRDSHSQIEFE